MKQFFDTYVKQFKELPRTVLEIGSRDGNDAETLRIMSNLEPWKTYVVEPHPELYRLITINYPFFNVYPFAISEKAEVLSFNAIPSTQHPMHVVGTSSLLKKTTTAKAKNEGETHPERWIKVMSITGTNLLELIDKPEIDIVKIDVEGLSYQVLKSFGPDIRLLKALHIEVEMVEIWEGQHKYDEIQAYLRNWGFQEMYYRPAFWGGLQGDSIWVRID